MAAAAGLPDPSESRARRDGRRKALHPTPHQRAVDDSYLEHDAAHRPGSERVGEAVARSWTRLTGTWRAFVIARDELPPGEAGGRLTRERWLHVLFDELSYTHQKEYVRWITEAKREETRKSRLAKSIELLNKGTKTPD